MRAMYQQPDPTPTRSGGAFCAEHAERAAVTICNRCGGYACDACLRVGVDRLDYCFRCVPLTQRLAARGARLRAFLIDRFATLALPPFIGNALAMSFGRSSPSVFVACTLLGMLGVLGMIGYQLHLLTTTGQSLGKRAMGLKVVRVDGSPVDLGRLIFLRNLVPEVIGVATCGLFGVINALFVFGNDRRCLHDHIADTQVIQVDAPGR